VLRQAKRPPFKLFKRPVKANKCEKSKGRFVEEAITVPVVDRTQTTAAGNMERHGYEGESEVAATMTMTTSLQP
jgi:hypothetical protein